MTSSEHGGFKRCWYDENFGSYYVSFDVYQPEIVKSRIIASWLAYGQPGLAYSLVHVILYIKPMFIVNFAFRFTAYKHI